MDEKARKFFHKEYSELSDYERMMLDIMAEKEAAEEALKAEAAEKLPVDESVDMAVPADEPSDVFPCEEAPLEAHRADEPPIETVEEEPVPEASSDEEIADASAAQAEPEEPVAASALPAEEPSAPEAPAEESAPDPDDADDSDVKIAGDKPSETKAERIPLLVEEKNPELEPVVVSRPTIQFMNSIEREKKITRKVRAQRRRSGIVVAALCAALILVAFMYNGLVNKSWGILEKEEPTPEVTVAPPVVHETPAPTPEPTPEPVKEHNYLMERADLSWLAAQDRCLAQGGYLAVIESQDEFNRITAMADERGFERLWIGCRRVGNDLVWENGESVDFYIWGDGEPSYIDTGDGAAEDYIMLWKLDGRWCYNDSRNDPAGEFWGWRGTIGYVCEIES